MFKINWYLAAQMIISGKGLSQDLFFYDSELKILVFSVLDVGAFLKNKHLPIFPNSSQS